LSERGGILSSMESSEIYEIAEWRARRERSTDVPLGVPPFALEEPCSGCGARRIATMVWRRRAGGEAEAFPRMEPHFLCRDGHVLWQEVTDAAIPLSGTSGILGHFEGEISAG
jgi:hypothetical protein